MRRSERGTQARTESKIRPRGEHLLQAPFRTSNYNALQSQIDAPVCKWLPGAGELHVLEGYRLTTTKPTALWHSTSRMRLDRNRSVTGYDRTHNFQAGWTAELPFGKGKRWAQSGCRALITRRMAAERDFQRIQRNPVYRDRIGASLNAPTETQTADQVIQHVAILGGTGPGQSYFDPAAFAPVTGVRYGTSGLNVLRGPGFAISISACSANSP